MVVGIFSLQDGTPEPIGGIVSDAPDMGGNHTPLALREVLEKSLSDYRGNSILLVPPAIAFFESVATYAIFSAALILEIRQGIIGNLPPDFSYAFGAWGVQYLAVSFLVIVGQVSMTESVVSGSKPSMNDWRIGTKIYSFRILGLGLIYMLTSFGLYGVLSLFRNSVERAMPYMLAVATYRLLGTLLTTVVTSVFYVCLASATLNDGGLARSLVHGVNAIRKNNLCFFEFVALFFTMSAISTFTTLLGSSTGDSVIGSLSYGDIASEIVQTVLSPLWFLIAFRICWPKSWARHRSTSDPLIRI